MDEAQFLKLVEKATFESFTVPHPLGEHEVRRIRYKSPEIVLDRKVLIIRESNDVSSLNMVTYTVCLGLPPKENIVLDIGNYDAGIVSVSPNILVFTPENYAYRQAITVWSLPTQITEDSNTQIVHTIRNNESYGALSIVMPVHVIGSSMVSAEEVSGIVIDNNSDIGTYVKLVDSADMFSYKLRLRSRPAANVSLSISSDSYGVDVYTNKVLFTPNDWYVDKEVFVGIDRVINDISHITHKATDGSSLDISRTLVFMRNLDDSVVYGNVIYNNKTPHVSTEIKDMSGFFHVRLTKPPVGDIVIASLDMDSSTIRFTPRTLSFNELNWNRNRRVKYDILIPTTTYTGTGYVVELGDYVLANNVLMLRRGT